VYKWLDEGMTILQVKVAEGHFLTVEEGHQRWDELSSRDDIEPYVVSQPTQEELLAAERARMKCSRLQGRLVLGEATCDALDAMAADEATPWAMRQTINNAIEWSRTSQAMTELGYLLGYDDAQMDDLFRIAMAVEV